MELLFIEATVGFGPAIKVLQTYALPLGYVALRSSKPDQFTIENVSGQELF